MCFSATSSFIAAGLTGLAGLAAVVRVQRRREFVLAATPLFFATQQVIEGLLWLRLPVAPVGPEASQLTILFLLFAKVFWPVFAPLAALSAESDPTRQRWMYACLAIGSGVGLYFLWSVLAHDQIARVVHGHIAYTGGPTSPLLIGVGYFIATAGASALSSHAAVRMFAAIVIASSVVTYFIYWDAFSSVWCFFAAAASAVIVFHFERKRKAQTMPAGV